MRSVDKKKQVRYTVCMITAFLTIDDIATPNTPAIMDFLASKAIQPVMFCWGHMVERYRQQAVYAAKHGAILQNHSYSHPQFSTLSFEEAVQEIEKNEQILASLYAEAGVARPFKLFRFPYGDQGGANSGKLQEYLHAHGFCQLESSAISPQSYAAAGFSENQAANADILWTFDFAEYTIRPGKSVTIADSLARAEKAFPAPQEPVPQNGCAPDGSCAQHIILIHDHVETEQMQAGYFRLLIETLLSHGVRFVPPRIN